MIEFVSTLLLATFQLATPYLLTAQGELFAERSGVMNLGVEGIMVMGAFASLLGTKATGNIGVGILLAICAGALLGLIFAFLSVTLRSNQAVIGVAISSMIGWSLVAYLVRGIYGGPNIQTPTLSPIPIPVLSQIPVLGQALFEQNILTYLAVFSTPLLWFFLSRTIVGLKIKATGENPLASETMGVKVNYFRYLCTIFGGIMAALGGAALLLGYIGTFNENIINGRGYIAIALVILGQWKPVGVLAAALIFGSVDALQWRLQVLGLGIPSYFMLMLPYVLTIVVLVFTSRRANEPASLGIPYAKEEK
jgi:ABC-type uncharacterized transport system permease subunit